MVLQTPLLHLLRHRYGHACRLLTSGSWSSQLFAHNADVADIWQLRNRHRPFLLSPERWRLVRLLAKHDGPVYVSEDSRRQVTKIRHLLAMSRIANDRCVFLDQFPAAVDEHWIDQLLRFGQSTPPAFDNAAARQADELWLAPRLFLNQGDRDDRERWLRERGLAGRPLVLLQPGNKRATKFGRVRADDSKAWPIVHWAGLLRAMNARMPEACLLLCGSPAEVPLLRDIRAAAGLAQVGIASEDLPLRRLMALQETADSMVSVDTGPAHMAAAMGCPLVVLYGTESPHRWSRRSAVNAAVIELGGPDAQKGMADIPLESVVQAWLYVTSAVSKRR
ncbi:MAG: glycosyltransferase family 9 protein [Rudaea sp.]|nr:glycosyltransferase family 9 protein [Rudaea sp.]